MKIKFIVTEKFNNVNNEDNKNNKFVKKRNFPKKNYCDFFLPYFRACLNFFGFRP